MKKKQYLIYFVLLVFLTNIAFAFDFFKQDQCPDKIDCEYNLEYYNGYMYNGECVYQAREYYCNQDKGLFRQCVPGTCDYQSNKYCSELGVWVSDSNFCFECPQDLDCLNSDYDNNAQKCEPKSINNGCSPNGNYYTVTEIYSNCATATRKIDCGSDRCVNGKCVLCDKKDSDCKPYTRNGIEFYNGYVGKDCECLYQTREVKTTTGSTGEPITYKCDYVHNKAVFNNDLDIRISDDKEKYCKLCGDDLACGKKNNKVLIYSGLAFIGFFLLYKKFRG